MKQSQLEWNSHNLNEIFRTYIKQLHFEWNSHNLYETVTTLKHGEKIDNFVLIFYLKMSQLYSTF